MDYIKVVIKDEEGRTIGQGSADIFTNVPGLFLETEFPELQIVAHTDSSGKDYMVRIENGVVVGRVKTLIFSKDQIDKLHKIQVEIHNRKK